MKTFGSELFFVRGVLITDSVFYLQIYLDFLFLNQFFLVCEFWNICSFHLGYHSFGHIIILFIPLQSSNFCKGNNIVPTLIPDISEFSRSFLLVSVVKNLSILLIFIKEPTLGFVDPYLSLLYSLLFSSFLLWLKFIFFLVFLRWKFRLMMRFLFSFFDVDT